MIVFETLFAVQTMPRVLAGSELHARLWALRFLLAALLLVPNFFGGAEAAELTQSFRCTFDAHKRAAGSTFVNNIGSLSLYAPDYLSYVGKTNFDCSDITVFCGDVRLPAALRACVCRTCHRHERTPAGGWPACRML